MAQQKAIGNGTNTLERDRRPFILWTSEAPCIRVVFNCYQLLYGEVSEKSTFTVWQHPLILIKLYYLRPSLWDDRFSWCNMMSILVQVSVPSHSSIITEETNAHDTWDCHESITQVTPACWCIRPKARWIFKMNLCNTVHLRAEEGVWAPGGSFPPYCSREAMFLPLL